MFNNTDKLIFGQRISLNSQTDISRLKNSDCILPQIKVGDTLDTISISAYFSELRSSFPAAKIIPIIDLDISSSMLVQTNRLEEVYRLLKRYQISTIAIGIDEDNEAIQALSPRNRDEQLRSNALELIEQAVRFFLDNQIKCLVCLTVEELCPGGLDLSDGIHWSRHFVSLGVTAIIASAGTKDFPHLKTRKKTKEKSGDCLRTFKASEVWMGSAIWLLGKLNVPVLAQGYIENQVQAIEEAGRIGLAGIIAISVNDPSIQLGDGGVSFILLDII